MDGLSIVIALLEAVSCSQNWVSGSVLELTVNPGDNVTLYCDCKSSTGQYTMWFRNCSHENQPVLVLRTRFQNHWECKSADILNLSHHFRVSKNESSECFDLLIMNTTKSDEGLYYCGTEYFEVGDKEHNMTPKFLYKYGNATTRILLNSSEPHHQTPCDCGLCWTLLLALCPASVVLSSVLFSLLVYLFCQKTAKDNQVVQQSYDAHQTRETQDEDVCYAALDARPTSQRPKKKKPQSSDFSIYSAIKTPNT
ncbi:uncharacterized protein LOC117526249 [Thalassophryne amazonica]|uniref:uncharacterized protein LOC117526249 n=1 Tax=Thalassophryne amazonica TaxID=390379 RepID=UPI0014717FAF|nr:uncharacterized protein LOC117526249 [Thalassophryne amazonica]